MANEVSTKINIQIAGDARDLDAERIFTYNNESYIVFDTKDYRGANTYFCVKMK